jgi:hypothetical protein
MSEESDQGIPDGDEDEELDPVGFADEQSFPASDPPSAWSGGDGSVEPPEHREG